MTNFDYNRTKRNSQMIEFQSNEFNSELAKLSLFEQNVHSVHARFQDMTPVYDVEKGYSIRIANGNPITLPMTENAVNGVLGKTGLVVNKGTFNGIRNFQRYDVKDDITDIVGTALSNNPEMAESHNVQELVDQVMNRLSDLAQTPIGFDYLYTSLEKSKRDMRKFTIDEHKVLIHNERAVALVNHGFPHDAIHISGILEAWRDQADVEGFAHPKARLYWDQENGIVRANVMYDKVTVQRAQVNDEVGFGFTLTDGKFGSEKFRVRAYSEHVACTNGIIGRTSIANLEIKHTSYKNMATNLGDFLFSNGNFNSQINPNFRIDRAIAIRLKSGGFPREEIEVDRFYPLFAETLHSVLEGYKLSQIELMERAASMSFEDLDRELDKLFATNRWLNKGDRANVEEIWNRDDTINTRNPSKYDLSLAFSRYANDPDMPQSHSENMQLLAQDIMVNA